MVKPVPFGPTIQNAYEASLLVARGGAKLVQTAQQLVDALTVWLNDTNESETGGSIGKQLIDFPLLTFRGTSFVLLLIVKKIILQKCDSCQKFAGK